ncbi:MAG: ABC transporter permease [Acidobacteriota bacterium]
MSSMMHDVRLAIRSLRKRPGFTAVAVATLVLGIGANTAIFTLVRAVLLAPLPYPEPDRLVQVWPQRPVSLEMARAFEASTDAWGAVSAYGSSLVTLTGEGRPAQLAGLEVAPAYFEALGVEPGLGRAFTDAERRVGAEPVAILSDALWRSRFAGDPGIIGRTLRLGGELRRVVGVMPEGHRSLVPDTDVWLPIILDPAAETYREWAVYRLLARLEPGVSPELAQVEARRVVAALHRDMPAYVTADARRTTTVEPLLDRIVGGARTTLWLLFGAVALVLVVACANVANLMLARGAGRRRELALRSALGAGRRHLFTQVLTESLVLAVAGGALGALAAAWTVQALEGRLAASLPRVDQVAIDGTVLLFSTALSTLAGIGFGLLPAFQSTGVDLADAMKRSSRSITSGPGRRSPGPGRLDLHRGLVAAEIAVSVILVVGAGLLTKSVWRANHVDLGFETGQILTLQIQPDARRFGDGDERSRLYGELVDRLAELPGVESAGGVNQLPLTRGDIKLPIMAKDRPAPDGRSAPWTSLRIITPGFMETLGVELVAGRAINDADRARGPAVGLVNRALASQLWGEESPLGRELVYEDGSPFFTVVGVVADTRQRGPDQPIAPQAYRPASQETWATDFAFALRTSVPPAGLITAVEEAVWALDSAAPITEVRTMEAIAARSLAGKRQLVTLFSGFALLALILGAVGVYGVTAFMVGGRTRETAIRMALGADARSVVLGSLGRLAWPVGLGLAAGLLGAWSLSHLLGSLLFEVKATDPGVFLTVALVLTLTVAVAGYPPARRASRVDPAAVLGSE